MMSQSKQSPITVFSYYGVTLLSAILSLYLPFLGCDLTDTFYHLNMPASPLTIGTSFFISSLQNLGVHELLTFRLIAMIIHALPYLFLWVYFRKDHYIGILIGLIYSCQIASQVPVSAFMLGHDLLVNTLAFFIVVLSFHLFKKDTKSISPSMFLLSALIGTILCVKLTSIVFCGWVIVGMLCVSWISAEGRFSFSKRALNKCLWVGAFSLIAYLLLLLVSGHLTWAYIESIFFTFFSSGDSSAESMANINPSYSLGILFGGYLQDLGYLLFYTLSLFLIGFIWHKQKAIICKSISVILLLCMTCRVIMTSTYNWDLSIMSSALFVGLSVLLWIQKGSCPFLRLKLIILCGASFFCILGTNTGLLKLTTLYVLFIPFLYDNLQEDFKKIAKPLLLGFLVLLLGVGLTIRLMRSYEDPVSAWNAEAITLKGLNHIRTTPSRARYLESVLTTIDTLGKDGYHVLTYGRPSHAFDYLLGAKQEVLRKSFWQHLDEPWAIKEVNTVITEKSSPLAILVFENCYPYEDIKKKKSPFEEEMIKLGGRNRPTPSNYIIYTFNDPQHP